MLMFIAGFFIGGFFGLLIMAILAAGKTQDDLYEGFDPVEEKTTSGKFRQIPI